MAPRPTERSRMAEYFAVSIEAGAWSMNSCSTLSSMRSTSSMKRGSALHCSQVSKFTDDRQHTAVRARPR